MHCGGPNPPTVYSHESRSRLTLFLCENSGATIHTRDGMLVNARRRETKTSAADSDKVNWAALKPAKDIGKGWFEKGIETKGGGSKCPMPFVE